VYTHRQLPGPLDLLNRNLFREVNMRPRAVALSLLLLVSICSAQGKKSKDNKAAPPQPSEKKAVASTDAPKAIGPYSQAIEAGEFVFAAGQVAIDPASGQLVAGDIKAQTDRVLKNLSAVLGAAGSSMDKVVKTTVYLKNISDFAAMNEVYGTYFKNDPPARATVGVAALPRDALVEIEVVALK
jgi:2-iminobutanoate/2-iminopropanoate deaminase